MRLMLHQARLPVLSIVLAGAGCNACSDHRPYTPYTLDPSPSGATSAPAPVAIADAGGLDGGFPTLPGTTAPDDGKSWPLDGVSVAAPAGRSFAAGLAVDLDGDGKRDLLAWARAPDGLRGELGFASGAAPDALQTIAALPAAIGGRGCTVTTRLAQIGKTTASLELEASCVERASDKANRWIAILGLPSPASAAKVPWVRMELFIMPPPEREILAVSPSVRDEDGDGRDDLAFTFTLSDAVRPFPPPAQPPSAVVRFFDRPAGLSRDPSEPEQSLHALAEALLPKARNKSFAALPEAISIRALHAALCAEDGRALVQTSAGPIQCGEARSLEDTLFAEGTAALARSSYAGAISASLRLEHLRSSALGRRKELDRRLAKSVDTKTATVAHKIAATPATSSAAAWGPLRFESGGALLVRTKDGVVRVDGATFAEAPAPEITPWPEAIAFPIAAPAYRLALVSQRCEESTLSALLESAAGGAQKALPLPIATPFLDARATAGDGPCAAIASLRVTPIDADDAQGLVFAVGADVVTIDATPQASSAAARDRGTAIPGSPRSPDGGSFALATPRGVLVQSEGAKPRLLTGTDIAGAWGCTTTNGATRVACVVGGNAAILDGL